MKEDYLQPLFLFLGFVLLFIPGIVIGSYIFALWYAIIIFLFLNRRTDYILYIYILWNMLNIGLYHYHLIGASYDHPFLKGFNPFLIIILLASFILDKKNNLGELKICFKWMLLLAAVALISALINRVDIVTVFKYFFVYYRWLLFAYILIKLNYPLNFFRILLNLITIMTIFNSVLGVLQQFVLPPQLTPDGYEPAHEDLASGLMGAAAGQTLTVLCIALASFYIIRYITNTGKNNIFFISLLLAQPFCSSSKGAMGIMFGCLGISLLIVIFSRVFRRSFFNLTFVFKSGFFILLVTIGYSIYAYNNQQFASSGSLMTDPIKDQYASVDYNLQDLMKVQGYIITWSEIAPTGRAGLWLGVGPSQFLFYRGVGVKTKYSEALQFKWTDSDYEVPLSSAEKQDTEVVALLGELGIIGIVCFILMGISVYRCVFKIYKKTNVINTKILLLSAAQFVFALIFYSFYYSGWFSVFFFIPLWIMIAYGYRSYKAELKKIKI